jgi:DNA polymerase III delta subunit
MATSANELLKDIDKGEIPAMILVGGNSDFLVDRIFADVRDRILEANPAIQIESYVETADLGNVLDSFRTGSLFGGKRLLILPEVNAFVTKKEVVDLFGKATTDWSSAKTDRKRSSSVAKLLHLLGLIGRDVEDSEGVIADAVGLNSAPAALTSMLEFARSTGKKASRGEGDASLLAESAARGGAPGATLLMKTGEIPRDSATINIIDRAGAVVVCNLTREQVTVALDEAIRQIAAEANVKFQTSAVARLRERMGIDRILADKFSRDVPDLRLAVSEAERLATLVGGGGTVTAEVVDQQIASVGGGMRYELASLFAEGKALEAVAKLRDLVSQSKREDPRSAIDIHYGKFLFPLADELRQMIAIRSFAKLHRLDIAKSIQYNRFRDTLADQLGEYLQKLGVVRQKPHPFALHRKYEASRLHRDEDLFSALGELAEIDFRRKSGGVSAELGLEALILSMGR